ncbi:hypothetical protein FQN54_000763 [Arachnomyces sp. PD_36]|nr:hypothetical protein FQN54_000763 [Arachnomyces sp. PD_36]
MGVLRFPRPAALYIPKGEFNITTNMISPPLSPDFSYEFDTISSNMIPALEYISNKLRSKRMHVSLIIGRQKPFSADDGEPDLVITPISPLDTPTSEAFSMITSKAAKKFPLDSSSFWANTLQWCNSQQQKRETQTERKKYLIHRSLVQNEILFGQEGLTLLSMDRVYTFKHRLQTLSNGRARMPEHVYISSCAKLLKRTIQEYNGRPFSKAFFHLIYDHLHVRDDLLNKVATEYKQKYGATGIVIPAPPKPLPTPRRVARNEALRRYQQQQQQKISPTSSTSSGDTTAATVGRTTTTVASRTMKATSARDTRIRRHEMPPPSRGLTPSRGPTPTRNPRTPLSASDVTPITRNEWNILMGPGWNGQCCAAAAAAAGQEMVYIPVPVKQWVG